MGFGVNERGEIRFGLSAIKGMGESAAQAIVTERAKNGPYKDIFDFVQRIDFSSVNKKVLESLALSGGLDCFGLMREQYFGANAKGETFLDSLVRYGQRYQLDKQQQANSLFGMMEAVEIHTPPVPKVEPWGNIERLNRERDLVGIYLSAHPLDDYSLILRSLCNTHVCELEDMSSLGQREEITFGGIVTDVQSKFSAKGNPWGIVSLEDYQGSGKLKLFGEEWGRWQSRMIVGSVIYVTAKCVRRYQNSDRLSFNILNVEYMQTVKERKIEKFTVVADSDKFTDEVVDDILSMLTDCKGDTQLFFRICDREHNSTITLRSRNTLVTVPAALVNYLDNQPDLSYVVN